MDKDNKKRILVVDDDDNLRLILVDKLNQSGFDAFGAENGKVGLEKALEMHPDAILLDILMPIMNGWEMLEKLREDEWGKNAKVIMLTVMENSESVARAIEDGSFSYLIKTNQSMEDIVEKVNEILR